MEMMGEQRIGDDRSLQQSVARAGNELRIALGDLLDELAGAGIHSQQSLQSTLNLSQSVTSRVMSGARSTDPLATLARLPGPEGLRKMLRGASQAGVAPECLARVQDAVAGVEKLIDREVGDRYNLDALLCDWVHESRASFELRQRAAAFRAMSSLRGVQVQTFASSWLVHPSSDGKAFDAVQIDALLACRRVRPNAVMHTTTQHLASHAEPVRVQNLQGRPVTCTRDIVVPQFSHFDAESMETQRQDDMTRTLVRNLPLGNQRGADIVTAMHYPGLYPINRTAANSRTTGVAANVEPPARVLVLDIFLHDSVWPNSSPELRVFDTVIRGLSHPDDPMRAADQLESIETVTMLGRGIGAFRVEEIVEYPDLLQFVCEQRNWDPQFMRGYRVKMKYPIYVSQVCLAFEL